MTEKKSFDVGNFFCQIYFARKEMYGNHVDIYLSLNLTNSRLPNPFRGIFDKR
jgi:hypothetical protein